MNNHLSVFSRRFFLKSSVLALSGSITGVRAFSQKPKGVRLAVRGPFPDSNLRKRAEILSDLGFQGIELGSEYLDAAPVQILETLNDTGIKISAIVGSIKLLDPDPKVRQAAIELDRKRLLLAKKIGASGVIEVPTFGPCKFTSADNESHGLEDKLLIDGLQQLIPDIKRTGIPILLEPLTSKETHYMNLQSHGARIAKTVGSDFVGLLSDFYHMQMEETDITATLNEYGHHTKYVHLADGEARTEPGSLPFDYRPGFRVLKEIGFSGWLTIESGATDNPISALSRARKYILEQWRQA